MVYMTEGLQVPSSTRIFNSNKSKSKNMHLFLELDNLNTINYPVLLAANYKVHMTQSTIISSISSLQTIS